MSIHEANKSLSVAREVLFAEVIATARARPAIHYQRQANDWLLQLRGAARRARVSPIECAGIELDLFDALRSPLNLANGAALADLDVTRKTVSQLPEPVLSFREKQFGVDFLEAVRALAETTDRVQVESRRSQETWWTSLRKWAYESRQDLSHRLGYLKSFSRITSGTKILAVPRSAGHFADILPVARKLREAFCVETVFGTVVGELHKTALSEGFSAVSLRGETVSGGRSAVRDLRRIDARLIRFFADTARQIGALDPAESLLLIARTERTVRSQLRYVLDVAESTKAAISSLEPELLIVGNSYTIEGRVSALVARGHNVPTAAIEHGSIFPDDPIWRECPMDLVCAWGQPSKRALMDCGVSEERISVTGAPRFDEVFRAANAPDPTDPLRNCILVATSGPGDQVSLGLHKSFIRILYEAADQLPDIKWLVKLHRKDQEDLYRCGDQVCHPRVELVRGRRDREGLEIFDYLRRARGLLTILSSSALDAMALQVPVIAVDVWWPLAAPEGIEFIDRGCTRRVQDSRQLVEAARGVWNGDSEPSDAAADIYAGEHFMNRGTASGEVALELMKLVGRSSGDA